MTCPGCFFHGHAGVKILGSDAACRALLFDMKRAGQKDPGWFYDGSTLAVLESHFVSILLDMCSYVFYFCKERICPTLELCFAAHVHFRFLVRVCLV